MAGERHGDEFEAAFAVQPGQMGLERVQNGAVALELDQFPLQRLPGAAPLAAHPLVSAHRLGDGVEHGERCEVAAPGLAARKTGEELVDPLFQLLVVHPLAHGFVVKQKRVHLVPVLDGDESCAVRLDLEDAELPQKREDFDRQARRAHDLDFYHSGDHRYRSGMMPTIWRSTWRSRSAAGSSARRRAF